MLKQFSIPAEVLLDLLLDTVAVVDARSLPAVDA